MNKSLPLPLVFTAWGFRHGAAVWQSAQGLADLCKATGVRTVAVQLGGDLYAIHRRFRVPRTGQSWTLRSEADILRAAGLHVAVWGVANPGAAASELTRLGASDRDWLPQIEGPEQRDLVLDASARGLRAPSIVTNYAAAGDTPGEADRLRAAGVEAVFVECYNDAGPIEPYIDLPRMLWQGTAYGWKVDEVLPTLGTYHGELPAVYIGEEDIGREFGIYLAEPMTATQWQAYGELNAKPPPEPIDPEEDDLEPITDTQARESVKTVTQAAMSAYADPKPRGRNTVAWRIANADDESWNRARDEVVGALDDAGVPDIPT